MQKNINFLDNFQPPIYTRQDTQASNQTSRDLERPLALGRDRREMPCMVNWCRARPAAQRWCVVKDGNGSGSDQVESPCTQNRNPKLKPEPEPKTDSGENLSPKPNPWIHETRTDTRNPNGYPKPADKYTHIHMYK
jgi:hypothetical protein